MESVQSYPQNIAPVVMTDNGQQKNMFRMVLLVLLAAAMAALYYVVFHEECPPSKPTPTSKSITSTSAKDTLDNSKQDISTKSDASPVVKQSLDTSGGIVGVRYVRVQRMQPSPKNENIINITEVTISNDSKQIPIVTGVVSPLFGPIYNWQNLVNGDKDGNVGFAATGDTKNASITLDIGEPQTVTEIVVHNRTSCCTDRILGCELQLLDTKSQILNKWAFSDVVDGTAKSQGAKRYRVGKTTNMVLLAELS
jgi:hypothetical protein